MRLLLDKIFKLALPFISRINWNFDTVIEYANFSCLQFIKAVGLCQVEFKIRF